jgi:hypothetical protein
MKGRTSPFAATLRLATSLKLGCAVVGNQEITDSQILSWRTGNTFSTGKHQEAIC